MDLRKAAKEQLEEYLRTTVTSPCLLVVDEHSLSAIRAALTDLLGIPNVRNVASLSDHEVFMKGDTLCSDATRVSLVVAIVTSVSGEREVERLRRALPPNVRLQVVTNVESQDVKSTVVPFCYHAISDRLFELNCERCDAPLPFLFDSRKAGAFELDIEKDITIGYKANLKRVSLCLATSLAEQMKWDVFDSVHSIGFGGGLVANTVSATLEKRHRSSVKASLIIIDRTLDVHTIGSSDKATEVLRHLHDQLVAAGQCDEILPQLTAAVKQDTISPQTAISLAYRSASLAGDEWQVPSVAVDELAKVCGLTTPALVRILLETAQARKDCESNATEGKSSLSSFAHTMDADVPLIGTILHEVLISSNNLPPYFVRSRTFDVANVAKSIFGSVFGAGESRNNDLEIRSRPRLCVFFLGGFCDEDVMAVLDATSDSQISEVIIGGTSRLILQQFQNELYSLLKSQAAPTVDTKQKFESLFA